MVDVLTPEQRRLNMSRIKGRNTKPELLIRKALHARGLRYRLHRGDLPGKPDIVLSGYRAVVFVHGCFWHAHKCSLAKLPETSASFWRQKIDGNAVRDERAITELRANGWRVGVVWECAVRGPSRQNLTLLTDRLVKFIQSKRAVTQDFTEKSHD